MLYNDFLSLSISLLEKSLRKSSTIGFDLQVKQLPQDDFLKGKFHTKNWFMYCVKEAKDLTSQRFLEKYLNWSSSSFLFSGHQQSFKACADLTSVFNECNFNLQHHDNPGYFVDTLPDINHLNKLPFVPQTNSDVLKVSHFLNAILNSLDFAIWPDKTHICRLKPGAKASRRRRKGRVY